MIPLLVGPWVLAPCLLLTPRLLALPLDLAPAPPGATQVDAFFDEWAARPKLQAKTTVRGKPADPKDFSATVQLSFDEATLYFAVQVRDDAFVPGGGTTGDRMSLRFVAGGTPHRIEVALNGLEDSPPTFQLEKRALRGVQVSSTERRDGWALEFGVPLSAIPWARSGPVAFAAVFLDTDADPVTPESVISTAILSDAGDPVVDTFELGGTAGLIDAFVRAEGDPGKVMKTVTGQIVPGGPTESLIVTDKNVVLVGHGLPQRAAYMFFEHGWRTQPEIRSATLRNVDGRAGDELVIEHSEWAVPGETRVAVLEIYGVHDGFLKRMFAQKVEEATPQTDARAWSSVEFLKGKRGVYSLRVKPAQLKGFNEGNYASADIAGTVPFEPLPMPWEGKAPRVFKLERDVWNRQ